MDCPICLDILNTGLIKELSCGHKIHYKCFMHIVNREKNMYISCPICRQINTNISKPFDNPEENLKFLSYPLRNRCICKTKKGRRCKNKPLILNYGMCHIHNKKYLNKELYPLMVDFIYITLEQRITPWRRINIIDMGKKIIIEKMNKQNSVIDILRYFYEFYSVNDTLPKEDYHNNIYEYYGLEKPSKKWMELCKKNYYLF